MTTRGAGSGRAGRGTVVLAGAALLAAGLGGGCGGAQEAAGVSTTATRTGRLDADVAALRTRVDPALVASIAAAADARYRAQGDEGGRALLESIAARLGEAGITAARLLSLGEPRPTWSPRRAHLALRSDEGVEAPLVALEEPSGADRACVLQGSDAIATVELEVVRAEAVHAGASARGRLVLGEGAPDALDREHGEVRGALGVIVGEAGASDADAARVLALPAHPGRLALGFSLGRAAYAALRAATARGVARVRVDLDVSTGRAAPLALEARIEGARVDEAAIVIAAHLDGPGANDGAGDAAALAALAVALRGAVDEGAVPPPARTLVFLWAEDAGVSRRWLERSGVEVAAAFVLDGAGLAAEGARLVVEGPAPRDAGDGAGLAGPLASGGEAAAAALEALEARAWPRTQAVAAERGDGAPFVARGIPTSVWRHAPDVARGRASDRLPRVDAAELRRVAAAVGGVALELALGEEDGAHGTAPVGAPSEDEGR